MSDRTLTASEHPRALSPLVEAVRLENAIKRKRRQVEKLATKLEDAEFERQVFERELARVRAAAEVSAGCAGEDTVEIPEAPVVFVNAFDERDPGKWKHTTLREAYGWPDDTPCLVRVNEDSPSVAAANGGDACADSGGDGSAAGKAADTQRFPSRDGEATGAERSGVDDLERGQTVARSGETGWQPTASSVPGDPPAASAEQLAPSGTAGVDSELSVGVAATAMGGHEVPAQNRQPVEPPSDPATGTTRREPSESARTDASTGAVTDSGGDGRGVSASPVVRSDEPSAAGNFLAPPVAPLPGQDCKSGHGFVVTTTGNANGVPAPRGDATRCAGGVDMTGLVLGDLLVVSRRSNSTGNATWSCRCACGRTCVELGTQLRRRASDPKLAHLLACHHCREERTARRRAEAEELRGQDRGPHRCTVCREPGHNSQTCPSDPSNATRETVMGRPEKVRPRNGDCPKCFSMPSRVEGARCAVCRLEAEAPPRATDFTSGESPLGRAI